LIFSIWLFFISPYLIEAFIGYTEKYLLFLLRHGCNAVELVNVLLLPRVMLPASLNAIPISGFGRVICLDTSV